MPSTIAARSASMAAAADVHAELRIWRHRSARRSISSPGGSSRAISGWKIRRRTGTAIHDHTTQERGFAYVSTILDPYTRFTLIAGASYGAFQIPNTPGLTPNFTAFGISNFNSALLNENQFEQILFRTVAALQRSINGADVQLSYFTRYSSVHFIPDPIGDIIFNGVALGRLSLRFSQRRHQPTSPIASTRRTRCAAASCVRTDLTKSTNTNTLLPVDAGGTPIDAPFTVVDASKKLGYTASFYVQDEWRLTNWLMLNSRPALRSVLGLHQRDTSSARASASPGSRSKPPPSMPAMPAPSPRPNRCWPRRPISPGPGHDPATERTFW